METYYYVNGKTFKSSELDEKRKKMFESRGFLPLSIILIIFGVAIIAIIDIITTTAINSIKVKPFLFINNHLYLYIVLSYCLRLQHIFFGYHTHFLL